MGYAKATLEAVLTMSEMADAGLELRAATSLPLVLDGAGGWGDPMHLHRTIATVEAAGFDAIEIEDVVLPKQAHHHAGVESLVPSALMEAKVREAVAARRSADFLVIARTNATDLDEAARRAEAYRRAGADLLLITLASVDPTQIPVVAERVGGPLMYLTPIGGLAAVEPSLSELAALGYQLVVDGQTPLLTMYETLAQTYRDLARDGLAIRSRPMSDWAEVQTSLHRTVGLEALLDIERRTLDLD
jgi:methylisocitrate lyase